MLFLDVNGPEDGATVQTTAVIVHGLTIPEASLTISGEAASVDADGMFRGEVTLSPGSNVIEVVATDTEGNREAKTLSITSAVLPPQPFVLLIIEPQDQSVVSSSTIALSGRTGPEALVSVNGVSASVDEGGDFSTTVKLEPGPNIIDVVATNTDGRVLSAVIALIYRP